MTKDQLPPNKTDDENEGDPTAEGGDRDAVVAAAAVVRTAVVIDWVDSVAAGVRLAASPLAGDPVADEDNDGVGETASVDDDDDVGGVGGDEIAAVDDGGSAVAVALAGG